MRYGEFSNYPLVGFGSLTMFDPSRVPAGKATMHAWDYVPYERADGRAWDDTKHDYAERMLEHMENFIDERRPTTSSQYHCDSPVDMERTSPSFRRGDLHGIAATTYQSGAHRPTPDLGQMSCRASSGFISSGRSSIRAAACSAPAGPYRDAVA